MLNPYFFTRTIVLVLGEAALDVRRLSGSAGLACGRGSTA